jgi:hypothetical protein
MFSSFLHGLKKFLRKIPGGKNTVNIARFTRAIMKTTNRKENEMKALVKVVTAIALFYAFIFVMMLGNVMLANAMLGGPK